MKNILTNLKGKFKSGFSKLEEKKNNNKIIIGGGIGIYILILLILSTNRESIKYESIKKRNTKIKKTKRKSKLNKEKIYIDKDKETEEKLNKIESTIKNGFTTKNKSFCNYLIKNIKSFSQLQENGLIKPTTALTFFIDQGFSIEEISIISGTYIFLALIALIFVRNKLNPIKI